MWLVIANRPGSLKPQINQTANINLTPRNWQPKNLQFLLFR
jgi:hypothetical protein